MSSGSDGKLGFWPVAAIGVGGMVGGGIFAVLGLAVELAGSATPVAFALGGGVALSTAAAYARLSLRFPSQGGTVVFIDRAFGVDLFTGSLNNLLWLSYVVMLALYAFAFGSYGATFFGAEEGSPWVRHLLTSAAILLPTGLNLLDADLVGRAESWVVGIKITILGFFVAVGAVGVEPQRLAPAGWSPWFQVVAGGMIIFVAYEGFELIANAAADVRDRERTLPRALYASVLFVAVLYVAIAAVTVGTLPVDQVVAAKDYALAAAARPFLGDLGFRLIAAAALLSTLSAINATLYGAARLSYTIAKEGELPAELERKVWKRPIEGLLITAVLALVLANLGDLSSISVMGSAGFLLIFAVVNAADWKTSEPGGRRLPALAGAVCCGLALAALLWQTATTGPARLLVLVALVAVAAGVEVGYFRFKGRRLRLDGSAGGARRSGR